MVCGKKLLRIFVVFLMVVQACVPELLSVPAPLAHASTPSDTWIYKTLLTTGVVFPGSEVQYRIDFGEVDGASSGLALRVQDTYASGLIYSGVASATISLPVSTPGFVHNTATRTLLWDGLAVPVSSTGSITVSFVVGTGIAPNALLYNTGTVATCQTTTYHTEWDATSTFQVPYSTYTPPALDLSVVKDEGVCTYDTNGTLTGPCTNITPTYNPGDTVYFSFFYKNNSAVSVDHVALVDQFPAALHYTSIVSAPSVLGTALYSTGLHSLSWSQGFTLAPGETGTVVLEYTVDGGVFSSGANTLVNDVKIGTLTSAGQFGSALTTDGANTPSYANETDTSNNEDSASIILEPFDLIVNKSFITGTFADDEIVTYRLLVTNSGAARSDIALQDYFVQNGDLSTELMGFTAGGGLTIGTSSMLTGIMSMGPITTPLNPSLVWKNISLGAHATGYIDVDVKLHLSCSSVSTITNVSKVSLTHNDTFLQIPATYNASGVDLSIDLDTDTLEVNTGNNVSSVANAVTVPTCGGGAGITERYDLIMTQKTVDKSIALPGEKVTYTFTMLNSGSTDKWVNIRDVFNVTGMTLLKVTPYYDTGRYIETMDMPIAQVHHQKIATWAPRFKNGPTNLATKLLQLAPTECAPLLSSTGSFRTTYETAQNVFNASYLPAYNSYNATLDNLGSFENAYADAAADVFDYVENAAWDQSAITSQIQSCITAAFTASGVHAGMSMGAAQQYAMATYNSTGTNSNAAAGYIWGLPSIYACAANKYYLMGTHRCDFWTELYADHSMTAVENLFADYYTPISNNGSYQLAYFYAGGNAFARYAPSTNGLVAITIGGYGGKTKQQVRDMWYNNILYFMQPFNSLFMGSYVDTYYKTYNTKGAAPTSDIIQVGGGTGEGPIAVGNPSLYTRKLCTADGKYVKTKYYPNMLTAYAAIDTNSCVSIDTKKTTARTVGSVGTDDCGYSVGSNGRSVDDDIDSYIACEVEPGLYTPLRVEAFNYDYYHNGTNRAMYQYNETEFFGQYLIGIGGGSAYRGPLYNINAGTLDLWYLPANYPATFTMEFEVGDYLPGTVVTSTGWVGVWSGVEAMYNASYYYPVIGSRYETINDTNNFQEASFTVGSAITPYDLSVTVNAGRPNDAGTGTVPQTTYDAGGRVAYEVNYCNNSLFAITNGIVRTQYPLFSTYAYATGSIPSGTFSINTTTRILEWKNVSLNPSECKKMRLGFDTASSTPASTAMILSATIGIEQGGNFTLVGETNPTNNTDPASIAMTTAPTMQANGTKTIIGSPTYTAGSTITYRLSLQNQGTISGTASIEDIFDPSALTYVSATIAPTSTSVGNLSWSDLNINAGQTLTIDVTFTISASAVEGQLITNAAHYVIDGRSVVCSAEAASANNTSAVPLQYNTYDLAITKLPDGGLFYSGDHVAWVIGYQNNSTTGVDNVTITESFPTGFVFESASITPTLIAPYTWNIGAMAAGQTGQLVITGVVSGMSGDMLYNTTSIASPTFPLTGETNTGNNADTGYVGIALTPIYDLALIKTLGVGQSRTVLSGDLVTMLVTITNQGNQPASAWTLTDTIAPGLTLVDTGWTQVGPSTATYTSGVTLQPGQQLVIPVTYRVDGSFYGTVQTYAEISLDDGDDIDSTPDADPLNDIYNDTTEDSLLLPEDDHDGERLTTVQLGSIAGVIYHDGDYSHSLETGETLFSGWIVNLLSGGVVIASMTTDSSGAYSFTGLTLGSYSTEYLPQGIYTPYTAHLGSTTGTPDGTLTRLDSITIDGLTPDSTANNYGLVVTNSIAGVVYYDGNKGMNYDPDDQPIANATVTLYSGSTPIATTVTSATGYYSFDNLPNGIYTVSYTHTTAFTPEVANIGTVDGFQRGTTQGLMGLTTIALNGAEHSIQNNFGLMNGGGFGGGGGGLPVTPTQPVTPTPVVPIQPVTPTPPVVPTPTAPSIPKKPIPVPLPPVLEVPKSTEGYTLFPLPGKLFDTGTPKKELKAKGVAVIENKKVQTEMPDWVSPWDENTRNASDMNATWALSRIPFATDKTRFVIAIPSIGVVAPIQMSASGTDIYTLMSQGKLPDHLSSLEHGAFLYPGTSYPGVQGNSVVFAHSSDWIKHNNPFATLFAALPLVEVGAHIYVFDTLKQTMIVYTTTASYETNPSDVSVLKNSDNTSMTLFTCTPIGSIKKRWIIKATLDNTISTAAKPSQQTTNETSANTNTIIQTSQTQMPVVQSIKPHTNRRLMAQQRKQRLAAHKAASSVPPIGTGSQP